MHFRHSTPGSSGPVSAVTGKTLRGAGSGCCRVDGTGVDGLANGLTRSIDPWFCELAVHRGAIAGFSRRKAGVLLVFCLLGTGLIWDIVQIGAWAGMWVSNARTESFSGSVATTFSEEGMCVVCHAVREAKGGSGKTGELAVSAVNQFLVLVPTFAAARLVFVPDRGTVLVPERTHAPKDIRLDPPVPPPREV